MSPPNGSPPCVPHSYVWPGLWVYAGCPSLAPLPTAHCLPHLCVDSALHRGTSPIQSAGTLLLHCYYSVLYLIALFCPGGVAGPPYADCYLTALSLLCGTLLVPVVLRLTQKWPTLLYISLVLRPHCLTEVGLGALLSKLPWRGAI